MSRVVERFLKYVKTDTTSDEKSSSYPSTLNQILLLEYIAKELEDLGLEVQFDHQYVIAKLPRVASKTTVCYIAHVDTSDAVSGKDIKPIITSYNGGDLVLPHTVIQAKDLTSAIGQTVISSDGSTLLGADDKAGVSEIMSVAEYFARNPMALRSNLVFVFTPDEEIGRGIEKLDLSKIGADFGYTVDGGLLGAIEYENFNACAFNLTVNGRSIHPGSAKDVMKNAIDLFTEFHLSIPQNERPVNTEGYEGFYMVGNVEGCVEKLTASYIIRDHDKSKFIDKKYFICDKIAEFNARYGEGTFVATLTDSYYNMKDIVSQYPHIIDTAKSAFEDCGVQPYTVPIRGGTDGAMLSHKGLLCPNLSTGGTNFHSKEEFVIAESMEKMVEVLIKISEKFA